MRKTLYERAKEDNTMHKYPYGIKDFIDNTIERGLASALDEDWYMTKERLLDFCEDTLSGLVMLTQPVTLYRTIRNRMILNRELRGISK